MDSDSRLTLATGNHEKVLHFKKNAMSSFIHLGKELKENQEQKYFEELGFQTFEAYIESPEVSLGRRSVYSLISIYKTFIEKLGYSMDEISEVEYSKLSRILGVINVQPVSHKNWFEKAKRLSRRALEKQVKHELLQYQHSRPSSIKVPIEELKNQFEEKVDDLRLGNFDEILDVVQEYKRQKSDLNREKRIKKLQQISAQNKPLVMNQKFSVIYCDPPWRYDSIGSLGSPENHYPTMPTSDICSLPVPNICTEDCVLFLWATSPLIRHAFEVIDAWGFTYKTSAIWDKEQMGLGNYFRIQHEFLLLATKGRIPAPLPKSRTRSVIRDPRREHSRKPDLVYGIIENMYPELSKVELFARNTRAGWASWGNQATDTPIERVDGDGTWH